MYSYSHEEALKNAMLLLESRVEQLMRMYRDAELAVLNRQLLKKRNEFTLQQKLSKQSLPKQ